MSLGLESALCRSTQFNRAIARVEPHVPWRFLRLATSPRFWFLALLSTGHFLHIPQVFLAGRFCLWP
jgi:hypothetical protein